MILLFFLIAPARDGHDLLIAGDHRIEIPGPVRKGAVGADLIALFVIPAVSAAFFPERIKRAIAEQAVELRLVYPLMARKILAFAVLKN